MKMKTAVDDLMDNVFAYPLYQFQELVGDLCDDYGTEAVAEDIRKRYPQNLEVDGREGISLLAPSGALWVAARRSCQ